MSRKFLARLASCWRFDVAQVACFMSRKLLLGGQQRVGQTGCTVSVGWDREAAMAGGAAGCAASCYRLWSRLNQAEGWQAVQQAVKPTVAGLGTLRLQIARTALPLACPHG